MGIDITMFTEKRRDGRWNPADPLVKNEYYGPEREPLFYRQESYNGRNYALFAMLAGVRNRYYIVPLALPKGLPQDLSREIRQEGVQVVARRANMQLFDARRAAVLRLARANFPQGRERPGGRVRTIYAYGPGRNLECVSESGGHDQ